MTGVTQVQSDKSLSHRAVMLGALARGTSRVQDWLRAGDTLATLNCMRALGIQIEEDGDSLTIHGRGLDGLRAPDTPLDCVNAGTAIRLLAGVLAGQAFPSVLDGSAQLRRRPMRRVVEPLRQMGARITDTDGGAPLHLTPSELHGITYTMPVASGQVKSSVLLAGLFADSPTTVIEPGPARDHTERMLRAMGATIAVNGAQATIRGRTPLAPLSMRVPGDISSAAFLLVAGLLAGTGDLLIEHVGVNPTRTGVIDILRQMGGDIQTGEIQEEAGEPAASLVVRRSDLRGMHIQGEVVVRAIDEFPALMVAATQAHGETIVADAAELRVKETDRIAVMAAELRKLGATVDERPDGFRVVGPQALRGAVVDGHDDHRVAMALAVAGLVAEGETVIGDARCVQDSFPAFVSILQALGADIGWEADD